MGRGRFPFTLKNPTTSLADAVCIKFDYEVRVYAIAGISPDDTSLPFGLIEEGNKIKILRKPQTVDEIQIIVEVNSSTEPKIKKVVWTLEKRRGYFIQDPYNPPQGVQVGPEKEIEWNECEF